MIKYKALHPLYEIFWFLTSFVKILKKIFDSVIKIILGAFG